MTARFFKFLLAFICLAAIQLPLLASENQIKKVLPQLIDSKQRNSLSPSLYERDAYQAYLRAHAEERGGLRFAILWTGSSKGKSLKLRVELRGVKNEIVHTETIEQPVTKTGWFRTWSNLNLRGAAYQNFGDLVAWRVTLWDGEKMISEQKSFLW